MCGGVSRKEATVIMADKDESIAVCYWRWRMRAWRRMLGLQAREERHEREMARKWRL